MAAPVGCSWQGIERSLVALARTFKISWYMILSLPILTVMRYFTLQGVPRHLPWYALVWRRHWLSERLDGRLRCMVTYMEIGWDDSCLCIVPTLPERHVGRNNCFIHLSVPRVLLRGVRWRQHGKSWHITEKHGGTCRCHGISTELENQWGINYFIPHLVKSHSDDKRKLQD